MADLSSSGYFERFDYKLGGALNAILTDKRKDLASKMNRVRVEIQGNKWAMLGRQVLWAIRRWFGAKRSARVVHTHRSD
eukprot:15436976-Alexandrium_andersonii.AAC.2